MSEETVVERTARHFFPLVASVSYSSWPIPTMAEFLCAGTIVRLTAQGCEVS